MLLRCLSSLLVSSVLGVTIREQTAQERSSQLEAAWGGILDGTTSKRQRASLATSPVTRAVSLLKDMAKTLEKDMVEDEKQYGKMCSWCHENKEEKEKAIKFNTQKVDDLEATIDELKASSAGLKAKSKDLEGEISENRDTLAKATALRKKENAAFANNEKDSIANMASLEAAIVVLSKHHSAALPQLGTEPLSFFQDRSLKDAPWGMESKEQRDLDMFMSDNSFGFGSTSLYASDAKAENRFLQQAAPSPPKQTEHKVQTDDGWTLGDVDAVRTAVHTATSFAQRHGKDASAYTPEYNAQSGEIYGMLRQLKDEMERDLVDSQQLEAKQAKDFASLRQAKTAELEGGLKSLDEKKQQLAKADFDLAEAKEDLSHTKATLEADTKFEKNLKVTCDEADANFAERKKSRLAEMEAVADTIEILSEDDAKEAMSATFKKAASFLQLSSARQSDRRSKAASLLRHQAAKSGSADFALLAKSVELDAFGKVKMMIDRMLDVLNTQQADEVKKNDWCKSEIQSNDMATAKATDRKGQLEASAEERRVELQHLEEDVAEAKKAISREQVSLQEATVNRKKENLDFQKTIADQTVTIEVLDKAMNRLAQYYDQQSLAQMHRGNKSEPAAPPPQMKYKKDSASTGVMSLIEKLIYDAKEIMAESKKTEANAQAAYEEMVADSNAMIKSLSKSVLSKTEAKVEAQKDLSQKEMDLKATTKELERLSKTDVDLHNECDFLLNNFMLRQQSRDEEAESLKQAKAILSGANV
jgi:hypothetical protein